MGFQLTQRIEVSSQRTIARRHFGLPYGSQREQQRQQREAAGI